MSDRQDRLLTVIGIFVTATLGTLGAVLNARAIARVDKRVEKVETGVTEVHSVVNSRLSALLDRQEKLVRALEREGIAIPPEPGAEAKQPE